MMLFFRRLEKGLPGQRYGEALAARILRPPIWQLE